MAFIFSLSEEVSSRMVEVLQDFFNAYPLGKEFQDSLVKAHKEVRITDTNPTDQQQYPLIVVESIPNESVPVSLGNVLGYEEYNERNYVVYGGNANVNTTLRIYDTGKVGAGKLADVVFLALMHYAMMELKRSFIFLQPQVRFTKPTKLTGTNLGGDVWMCTVNVPIVTEWRQYFEQVVLELEKVAALPVVKND
jgi:hypothetical protein